ncbi:MAG TPA: cytidine/deoxycytidylate deaminase family protein [bacterium]|nr:cytidine/deoxycytidylate deaminase family protein [bacterium]
MRKGSRRSSTTKRQAKLSRPSWDEYFISIARLVSSRSTCLRRHVGAVVVKDKRLLSTGYNGAPQGFAHCAEVGCIRQREEIPPGERHELCRGIHAEQNAIVQAAAFGVSIKDSTLYCTHFPCVLCTKLLINAGVRRLVVAETYPDRLSHGMLQEAGIDLLVIA